MSYFCNIFQLILFCAFYNDYVIGMYSGSQGTYGIDEGMQNLALWESNSPPRHTPKLHCDVVFTFTESHFSSSEKRRMTSFLNQVLDGVNEIYADEQNHFKSVQMIFNQRTIRMVSKDECTANPDLTALCAKKDSCVFLEKLTEDLPRLFRAKYNTCLHLHFTKNNIDTDDDQQGTGAAGIANYAKINKSRNGRKFTHGICDNGDMVSLGPVFNVALIHLLDSFSNEYNLKNAITTVAHEFGHLLGANHDKITSYGYKSLMTAGPANEKDRKFSELSLKQISRLTNFLVNQNGTNEWGCPQLQQDGEGSSRN